MVLREVYRYKLKKYLYEINTRIDKVVAAEDDPEVRTRLQYAVEHGRRFRPLLFLLSCRMFGRECDDAVCELAAAVELLHKASLLHDDLVDEDRFRRGRQTFHVKFGQASAVIMGDLLAARAGVHFARHAPPRLVTMWAELYHSLCYGEMLDVLGQAAGEDSEERVNRIVYGKTASFIEFVMQAGACVAGADLWQQELAGEFGRHLGFAFQIINDWNNWSGLEAETGRCVGSDLARGRLNHISRLLASGNGDREAVSRNVQDIVNRHAAAARRALGQLGLRNRYTAVLERILDEKHSVWFWLDVDRD